MGHLEVVAGAGEAVELALGERMNGREREKERQGMGGSGRENEWEGGREGERRNGRERERE